MGKTTNIQKIKKELTELGVEFDGRQSEEKLIALLEESKQKHPEANEEENVESEEPKTYVVIHDFKDLEDNAVVYLEGDIYPRRANTKVDDKRIQELLSSENKIGKQLIEEQG